MGVPVQQVFAAGKNRQIVRVREKAPKSIGGLAGIYFLRRLTE
jgi:hypothetical protein